MKSNLVKTDFLVIGSGIAGLMATIRLAELGKGTITLITKDELSCSNSYYAQGGIASVGNQSQSLKQTDFDSHIADTLLAGDGLCNRDVVESSIGSFDSRVIDRLIEYGVDFSKNEDGSFQLHQEGGHSRQRIYCVADHTGRSVVEALIKKVKSLPNVQILRHHLAINLITQNYILKSNLAENICIGVYALDKIEKKVITINSKFTLLATGGAGKIFKYTTNPDIATGDGYAMAYRAGATLKNMEFVQFHPTVLYDSDSNSTTKRFLITEALRGENIGGILTTDENSKEDFVLEYDKKGSHSTRDIVARAVDSEIKKRGLEHLFLNLTNSVLGKGDSFLPNNFPDIFAKCLEKGFDIRERPIPIVPAAHYFCGGVATDSSGHTDINNLYAIGEVACTGLMGANRLASNSLPEATYFASVAAEDAAFKLNTYKKPKLVIPPWDASYVKSELDLSTMNQFWDSIRSTMTNLCGIERNKQRLGLAENISYALTKAADRIYAKFFPHKEVIELRNLALCAYLVTNSAARRRESRGVHFRCDYPHKNSSFASDSLTKKR